MHDPVHSMLQQDARQSCEIVDFAIDECEVVSDVTDEAEIGPVVVDDWLDAPGKQLPEHERAVGAKPSGDEDSHRLTSAGADNQGFAQ